MNYSRITVPVKNIDKLKLGDQFVNEITDQGGVVVKIDKTNSEVDVLLTKNVETYEDCYCCQICGENKHIQQFMKPITIINYECLDCYNELQKINPAYKHKQKT